MGCTLTTTDIEMPVGFPWLTNKMWLELVDLTLNFPTIFDNICSDFV
jgi:dynein heavy chain